MNPEILKFKGSHIYVFPYFYIYIISIWWQFVLAKVISCSNPSVINYPGEFFVEKNSSSVGLEFKDPFLTTYSPTWSKNKLSRVYEKCNHRNFRFNLKIGHLKFHRKTDIVRFQLLRFKLVKICNIYLGFVFAISLNCLQIRLFFPFSFNLLKLKKVCRVSKHLK